MEKEYITMEILSIKKIDIEDRCYLCDEHPVSYRVAVVIGVMEMNLCLCIECKVDMVERVDVTKQYL